MGSAAAPPPSPHRDAVKALLAAGTSADARCGSDNATTLHAAARLDFPAGIQDGDDVPAKEGSSYTLHPCSAPSPCPYSGHCRCPGRSGWTGRGR